jgi:uncharacterized membrane protein
MSSTGQAWPKPPGRRRRPQGGGDNPVLSNSGSRASIAQFDVLESSARTFTARAARFVDTHYAWLIAAITLVAAALRFSTLGLQSYWYDEAVTVRLVGAGPYSMLHSAAGSESTPPLYYVVAWIWTRVFGSTEIGLRSLSALCGTLAVPLAYEAGRQLVSRPAGALTAALATSHSFR